MLNEAAGNSKQHIARINDAIAARNWIKVSSLSSVFENAKRQSVWIRTRLPEWKGTDPALYIGQIDYFMQVFLNDSLIYSLGSITSENVFLGRNQNLIPLNFYNPGDHLIIHVWTGNGSGFADRNIILSSSVHLMKDIFRHDTGNLIFAVVFFLSGIVFFVFMFIFKDRRLLLGLALYVGPMGIFIFCNSPFIQLVFNAPYFLYHLGYLSKIGSSVGGFYIIEQIVAAKYKKIVSVNWKLLFLFLIFCTVFSVTTSGRFLDIMDFYIILLLIGIISGFIFLLKSLKNSQYEIKIIISGVSAIFLAGLADMIIYLYYGFESSYGYNPRVLYFGVTLLVISLIWAASDKYLRINRQKSELQKAELEAVKKENEVRRYFSSRLIESQESERNRIALELHDSLGQKLLLIKNQLLSGLNKGEGNKTLQPLQSISSLVGESISEIREIIYDLRPQYLDQLGLKTALESILEKVSECSDIKFHVAIDEISDIFSKTDEVNFYRIVQECINNIVKHSKASDAFIEIKANTESLYMKISDNGSGFDTDKSSAKNRFGITGIRERARMLDAALQINSNPEKGTVIQLVYKINNQ